MDLITPNSDFGAKITPHISYGELTKNQEKRRFCHDYQIKTAYLLCAFLELCRSHFGGHPVIITSGHRPHAINASIGGARQSEHLYNAPDVGAVDFYIKGESIHQVEQWCDDYWPYSVGYGAARGFVHLGIRSGRPRVRWDY